MKCPNCGKDVSLVKGKKSIKVVFLDEGDREFLRESNAIEGVYSDEALEDAEEAFRYAYDNKNKISLKYILEIHRLLMRRLNPKIAGNLREVQVGVMTSAGFKEAIDYKNIKEELKSWIKKEKIKFRHTPRDSASEEMKRIHAAFEKIHPFQDGNGRVGRILMNIQRINSDFPVLIIPEKDRFDYYEWFKENNGNV